MDEVGFTEYVKGDNRKFEIWYGEKEEVYIVQVGHFKILLETKTCIEIQKPKFINKNNFGHISQFPLLSCRSVKYHLNILCDVFKCFLVATLRYACGVL